MELQLEYFLLLAAALFCIGIYGLINSRNAVRVLMSIELLLNAVNLNLMAFSNYLDADAKGQVFFGVCDYDRSGGSSGGLSHCPGDLPQS